MSEFNKLKLKSDPREPSTGDAGETIDIPVKKKRGLGSPNVSQETKSRVASLGGKASKGGGRPKKWSPDEA